MTNEDELMDLTERREIAQRKHEKAKDKFDAAERDWIETPTSKTAARMTAVRTEMNDAWEICEALLEEYAEALSMEAMAAW